MTRLDELLKGLLLLLLAGCATPNYEDGWRRELKAANTPERTIAVWRTFRDFYGCKDYPSLKSSIRVCLGKSRVRGKCWVALAFGATTADCQEDNNE